ncbi:MAG: PHP domain-containing protein [Oscillospiraceae bacterium]
MTALDKKDLHVHTPFCPHRHTDAPLEAYLAAAERAGMAEVAFTEHAPLPIPLERTQYEENPNLSADGVDAYFRYAGLSRALHRPGENAHRPGGGIF